MGSRGLNKAEWREFFDRVSKALGSGNAAEVEGPMQRWSVFLVPRFTTRYGQAQFLRLTISHSPQ
jgi:hypothetical protein